MSNQSPKYNPQDIEPKWQKIWDETGVYTANLESDKPKYIAMSMFNYPSGAGIHIGHAMNYTISDVKARFKRQQGFESYHPVGWDAFGLPAENYAIKAGVSPQESMATIIPSYHKQYKAMGWSNDWEKEISTHLPEYYKWTQWIFSQMYKHGLAYQDKRMQWWCNKCQTVLANEQVIDGKCWRHDGADDPMVEKKEVKQWFFKITEYADELLEATDDLDWTESVKTAQKNWIGRSVGAEVKFAVEGSEKSITVFTTRADTLFGATFLVLAPEHELVNKLTTPEQKEEVEAYIAAAALKTEVDRQAAKQKTGVFTGAYAINPVNGEKVPIWIADYVLTGYGTGAIMAVPAHDERDNEFAKRFNLPIAPVIKPVTGVPQENPEYRKSIVAIVYNPRTEKYLSINWGKDGGNIFIGGGQEEGEDIVTTALREIREETGYQNVKHTATTPTDIEHHYFAHSKRVARRIDCSGLLFELEDDQQFQQSLEADEQGKFTIDWLTKDEVLKSVKDELHRTCFEQLVLEQVFTAEGLLINSGAYNGMTTSEARDRIITDLAGKIGDEAVDVEYTTNSEPVFIQKVSGSAVKKDQPFVEREAITAIVKHWKEDKYIGLKWKQVDWETLITGGVEDGQTPEEAAIAEIREETGYLHPVLKQDFGTMHAKFFHVPKNENRHAHFSCLYFELADGVREEIAEEEQQNHEVVWLSAEEMTSFKLPASHRYMWDQLRGNSSGLAAEKVNYKMRDWSVSRQRYWGAPIPIVNCEKCGTVLVPEDELPVELPELTDFVPSGDGRSALARATDWLNTTCPDCGGPAERETDTLDTYICSSWYMFRYFDPRNQQEIFESNVVNKWMPIDFYNGGDHATAHMLYARFVTRFFSKIGLVNSPEPFKQFLFNGKVRASDGSAFSKSKGNGIDPLDVINNGYGADALRMYLMFAAPLEIDARWDPQGVPGTFRFLSRLWNLVSEYQAAPQSELSEAAGRTVLSPMHAMVKKASQDIEENHYNTAIAAIMAGLNDLYKQRSTLVRGKVWQQALEMIVATVAPFAPHIADELWQQLGHSSSVHKDTWPKWDEAYLVSDVITIVVQVNGKLRGEFSVSTDSTKEDLEVEARRLAEEKGWIKDEVKRVVVVPGRLVNIVV